MSHAPKEDVTNAELENIENEKVETTRSLGSVLDVGNFRMRG